MLLSGRRFRPFFRLILPVIFLLPLLAESIRYNPVSRDIIEARLKRYRGNDRQREATLKQMFGEAGCDDQHLSEQGVKGAKQPNVVCILPGIGKKAMVVGAHFDHVSEGDGVVDNWSGASLLPSLFEALKSEPRNHTYIFIGFTAEENGEIGSRFYVRQMSADEVAATDAMVNMDTLGLAPTEVWESHSDKQLTGALAAVAGQLHLSVTGVNVDNIGSTDSEQFSERKIPSITIHSLTQDTWNAGILHTRRDKISAIQLDDYYNSYRLIAGYIAFLDAVNRSPEH